MVNTDIGSWKGQQVGPAHLPIAVDGVICVPRERPAQRVVWDPPYALGLPADGWCRVRHLVSPARRLAIELGDG